MIKYPYLPEGGAYHNSVSADNPFMKRAKENMERSGCRKHATSAVIVKNGEIIAEGSNSGTFVQVCPRVYKGYGTGEGYRFCKDYCGQQGHAEVMAVRDGQAKGVDLRGADLYLYGHWWACKNCWDTMIAAGINNVYVTDRSHELFNDQVRDPGIQELPKPLRVYVSGPLTHLKDETVKTLYERIGALAQKHGMQAHVPHKHTDPAKHPYTKPEEVYTFDLSKVRDADLMICYVGEPSLGVGMELEMALRHHTLVVLLSEEGTKITRIALGSPALIDHIQFRDHDQAIDQLDTVLARFTAAAKRKNMSSL